MAETAGENGKKPTNGSGKDSQEAHIHSDRVLISLLCSTSVQFFIIKPCFPLYSDTNTHKKVFCCFETKCYFQNINDHFHYLVTAANSY